MKEKAMDDIRNKLWVLIKAVEDLKMCLDSEVLNFCSDEALKSSTDKKEKEKGKESVGKKSVKGGKFFCTMCNKEIVGVTVKGKKLSPEQIRWYSEMHWGRPVCWGCQNNPDEV